MEKITNKLKNLDKANVLKYFIIQLITLFICQNFLQMHYSSDTYVLFDLGYMAYPSKYFLLDGRLISTLVCYMAGILNIPMNAYIIGMNFIGIIFVGIAIYLMSKILEDIIKPQNNTLKILLIASSFILILNQFTLEYLLFPESAVMCLGVLLNVVAVKMMVENPKHKYIKIFFILLIATLCYQGLLNMFPVLAVMTYIVKHIVDKREFKVKEKEFIIEMFKLAVIVLLSLAICMTVVKIGKTALNSKQDRMMHLIDFEAVMFRAETVAEYMDELWNKCMFMLPEHTNTIVLVASVIFLLMLKPKPEIFFKYLLLLFICFIICVVPMFMFNTGVCGRVNSPLMMIWGAALIVLLTQSTVVEKPKLTKILYVLVVISFIIHTIFLLQNITEHIAANRVDENMGRTIKYAIEKYEKETGNKVTKFSYAYDREPQQYAVGIKPIGSLTERKFACSWSVLQAMRFYCERDFKLVRMPFNEYYAKILEKDYTEFSEEQLIFVEDTLLLVVY